MFFEVILALVGLGVLLTLAFLVVRGALDVEANAEVHEPYRRGLAQASRISAAAWEAEQALYHHARHAEGEE